MELTEMLSNDREIISNPKNQEQEVFGHLILYRSITPGEAMAQYGIYRLSARIHNLRKIGLWIKTERVTRGDRRFARYVLTGSGS